SRGGAEIMSDSLVDELRARGHEADLVSVPFKWYPGTRVLTQAFLWRMLDLEESDGRSIDMVVATKFPSYVVRHPEKRVWLIHQLLEAVAIDPSLRAVVVSDGPDRGRLEAIAREHHLDGRVEFRGRVSVDELADLYASCLAVYYAPVDEDFGMGPYESFLAEKPVITTTDAGGPLDVVFDRG